MHGRSRRGAKTNEKEIDAASRGTKETFMEASMLEVVRDRLYVVEVLERATGFEPATPSLVSAGALFRIQSSTTFGDYGCSSIC